MPSEAGYFDIDSSTNKHYFYWSASARDQTTDKVLLWLTGGPGCSSMLALLGENGPCQINETDGNVYTNPYGWNTNATAIWLDQPAGTGFSYANQAGYDGNQTQTSRDVYRFLQAWFKAHPSLQNAELYLFCESYGGHYCPSSAYAIYEGNNNLQPGDIKLNLAGVGIGNGLTSPTIQYQYYAEMGYNYTIQKKGTPDIQLSDYIAMQKAWPQCQKLAEQCQTDTTTCSTAQQFCDNAMFAPYEGYGWNPYNIKEQCGGEALCGNYTAMTNFLTAPATLKTLGIDSNSAAWTACNYQVNGDFADDWMKRFDLDLVPLLNSGIRITVYAGDLDFICNWLGNQAWTLALQWNGAKGFNAAPFNDWHVNGQVAGSVRTYGGFSFVRVTDAGHMVPADQPKNALSLVTTVLFNQQWA